MSGSSSTPSVASRCSLPPWALASHEFQENPWPIEIVGVRQSEPRLFSQLDALEGSVERGDAFYAYLLERFQLDEWGKHKDPEQRGHDCVRFLRGWGADSNSRSGAVLKAWVESRFGISPTYHHGRLAHDPEARQRYHEDRMRGEAATMGIAQQLDLLYTFCQYELERRYPGQRWLTLYRGTHDPEEYAVDKEHDQTLVQLNNLSSFTSNREIAWEFGSSVWEVQIPVPKVVFFSGLLPRHLLEGENEHLVLGGRYRVRKLAW